MADSTIASISPDFTADAGAEVSGDNSFATIAKLDGKICSWLNASSGSSISVGVANPSSADLATYEAKIKGTGTLDAALSGTAGNRGYVENGTEVPVFDVFTETGYWVSISSVVFDSPISADSILSNILQTLPSG
ncbi:hypothetical protein B7R25_09175 [Subtercola boreus]|uniref:Uncharacterized protein n=1 Tax=Subtercola boreus TaxID=120213 RepID=A0A3E0W9R5_9MICO|nr:hypothetical protein B7R24_09110 [Subtercola boreus]RFA20695.1 hypothetical protein B7R23_09045 [Subtercola boreus]RFA26905.1 hypothetical protein B7R25_09175 [Subtercola boreus]